MILHLLLSLFNYHLFKCEEFQPTRNSVKELSAVAEIVEHKNKANNQCASFQLCKRGGPRSAHVLLVH